MDVPGKDNQLTADVAIITKLGFVVADLNMRCVCIHVHVCVDTVDFAC